MLKAYWLRLLLFTLVGGAIAWLVTLPMPKKYEAVVEMLVDQKPLVTSVAMSGPESTVSDLIDFARPRSLATTVQQVVAFGNIRTATSKVAEQMNMREPIPGDGSDLDPIEVLNNVSIGAEAQSDIVSVRVRMSRPELAEAVANEIYLEFIRQNQNNSRRLATQAIDSLQKGYSDVQAQLKEKDAEVQKIKDAVGSPDINTYIQAEISAVASLKQQRDSIRQQDAFNRDRVRSLEREFQQMPKDIKVADSVGPNPNHQALVREIAAARVELATLRERYTDDREEVKAARQKVWTLEAAKKEMPANIPLGTQQGPDNITNTIRGELAQARAALDGTSAQLRESETRVAEREGMLKSLIANQTKFNELQRDQISLERLMLAYTDRLKSLQAAQTGRLAPVAEITGAFAFPEPVSPKLQINILFGVTIGLILGVLSMLATEARRQPVRSLAQLNALALRPVYRMVPELRQPYRGLSKAPAEAYDSLLANYLRSGNRPYRIAVVGINKDSGASTAAINLAIAGSRHGGRVLYIQCDPKGGLPRMTGQPAPANGTFTEVTPLIKGTSAETVLTISGDRNPEIAKELREQESELTIIDLEPTTQSAEYAFLAPHVDEVILLVRSGKAKSVEFLQAQQALKESGCPTVTVAFTRASDLAVVTEMVDSGPSDKPAAPKVDPKSLEG